MQTATVNNANTVNATANNNAWAALVQGVQGQFVQPIDIATANVKRYDMGREVGTFVADEDSAATVTVERKERTVRVAVTAKAKSADAKPKKADIVRAMIATAKAANGNANTVIAEVMAQLGFAKALATAYVRNNWDRV